MKCHRTEAHHLNANKFVVCTCGETGVPPSPFSTVYDLCTYVQGAGGAGGNTVSTILRGDTLQCHFKTLRLATLSMALKAARPSEIWKVAYREWRMSSWKLISGHCVKVTTPVTRVEYGRW